MYSAEELVVRLQHDPGDMEAYEALKGLYADQGDVSSLANLIAGWAGWTTDDEAACNAYLEVGDLLLHHMQEPEQAQGFYAEALTRHPLSVEASEALQALYESQQAYAELTEFLQHQVQSLTSLGAPDEQIAVLRYRLGELWAKQFHRVDEALHHYRRAFALDPKMVRAIYETRMLLLATGDLRGATELYDREIAVEPSPQRRVELLTELADLYRRELDDLDGAVSALQRARGAAPDDERLTYELASTLARRAEGLDVRTAAADFEQVADLLCELAGTQGEPGTAIEYLESALGYAPAHEGALSELERLREDSGDQLALAPFWVAYLQDAQPGQAALRRRLALARAYVSQGQLEDAMFCLEAAADAGSDAAADLLREVRTRLGKPSSGSAPPPPPRARPMSSGPPPGEATVEASPHATRKPEAEPPRRRRRTPMEPPHADDFLDLGEPESPDEIPTQMGDDDELEALRASAQKSSPPVRDAREDDTPARPMDLEHLAAGARSDPPAASLLDEEPTAETDDDELDAILDASAREVSSVPPPAAQQREPATRPPAAPAVAKRGKRKVSTPAPPPATPRGHRAISSPPAPSTPPSTTPSGGVTIRELRRRVGELTRARRNDEAVELNMQILHLDPLDREAFSFLDSYYRRKQQHRQRAELLAHSAENEALPLKTRQTRLREAANVYEARVKDTDAAVAAWRALAELEGDSEETHKAIKRLLERAERWDDLVVLLEHEAGQITDANAKVPVLRRLSGVHRDKRGDLGASADVLEQIVALVPHDRAARDTLLADLLTLERYEDAVPLFEHRIEETVARSQKVPLLKQLADIHDEHLNDTEAAFACLERIVEVAPSEMDVLERMARLDERSGNHERLLRTLERQAAATTGSEAGSVLARMARIAEEHLMDRERAAELLEKAVDLAPADGALLDALCGLFERDGKYEDLMGVLKSRARTERDPDARCELLRRIAHLATDHLQDEHAATVAWEQLLEIREDREALDALRERAMIADEPTTLADVLGRLAALETDVTERRDLLYERGRLLADRLSRPEDAIAALTTILDELDPGYEPALDALAAACEAAGDYRGLAHVLEGRLGRTEDPLERLRHARQLADLYEGNVPDPQKAIRALHKWAEGDPGDPEPHRRLKPHLEKKRRYKELVVALDALSQLESDPEARASAAIESATVVHAKFKDVEGAWARLAPWVEVGHQGADQAIEKLAQAADLYDAFFDLLEQAGRHGDLLASLEKRVAAEPDQERRVGLFRRMASVQIDYLQDEEGAAETYKRMLELREDADALRFVQGVAIRNDDPETLANVLARLAALERNPDERRDLMFDQARLLAGRLDRPSDAIPILQTILQHDPGFEPAVDELLGACEAAGDHATLAQVLEKLLSEASTLEAQAELAMRLADVYEHRLGNARRAVAALEKWAVADPGNPEPHRRLKPHLSKARRYEQLVATLDALAGCETTANARTSATIEAAEVARAKLGDHAGAWDRLSPLVPLELDAADEAIRALATEVGRLDELYDLLADAGRYDKLVDLMRERVVDETDAEARVELYRRIARTMSDYLDDDEGAYAAWCELLDVREDREALHFLRARALRRDAPTDLGDALRRLAEVETDASERRDLIFERGRLLNTRLSRPTEAVIVLRELVEVHPDFEPARDELVDACEAAHDDVTLAWTLELSRAREPDPEVQVELSRRLADLYEGPLDEPAQAIGALVAWTATRPDDPEPRRRLLPLLTDAEQYEALRRELDALSACEQEEGDRTEARLESAELSLAQLSDPAGAWERVVPLANQGIERAELLLQRVAFEAGMLEALCTLYEGAERYDDLVTLLREQAESTERREERAELYARCARILGGPLGDEMAAAEAWREVLAVREDAEALSFLRGVAHRLDDPDELAELLGRLANLTEDAAERRDLLFERALLLSDRLERPKEAIEVLRYLVGELDPAFRDAAEELVAVCETLDDHDGLAMGLERMIALSRHTTERAELAERLANLCADELEDPERELSALLAWSEAAPDSPEAHRRLRPHLERRDHAELLLRSLDALTAVEPDSAARAEAAIAAAHVAFLKFDDAEGAWRRLAPVVLSGNDRAERDAHELAKRAHFERPLANLYVMRAKQTDDPQAAARDWQSAAKVYDELLGQPLEALEASLRALAVDMSNRSCLYEIDRLAIEAKAWQRLWQVYNRLVQETSDTEGKIELLKRHADILEKHAKEPSAALERVLQICNLAPELDEALERAEELAHEAGSHSELLWIYENLCKNAADDERRAVYLLRAARVADLELSDREQAMENLKRALALTEDAPQVAGQIEDVARELDRARPELGKDDARRALVRAHVELAQTAGDPFGPMLVLRASQLLRDELGDNAACFDALRQGATLFPSDMDLVDAFEAAGRKLGRLDALDAHLARVIPKTSDEDTRLALLERRGRLLSDQLKRHANAAQVWGELLELEPDSREVADRLFTSLEKAGRFQELLRAYDGWLSRLDDVQEKVALMRKMAALWERELRNNPSAIEVWNGVRELVPDDEEATKALQRLGAA